MAPAAFSFSNFLLFPTSLSLQTTVSYDLKYKSIAAKISQTKEDKSPKLKRKGLQNERDCLSLQNSWGLNIKNFPHHSIKDICWLLNSFSSILQLSKHCLWQFVLCLFYQPGFPAHTTNANCYSSKAFLKFPMDITSQSWYGRHSVDTIKCQWKCSPNLKDSPSPQGLCLASATFSVLSSISFNLNSQNLQSPSLKLTVLCVLREVGFLQCSWPGLVLHWRRLPGWARGQTGFRWNRIPGRGRGCLV